MLQTVKFAHVKPNILLLQRLSSHDVLRMQPGGKLERIEGKKDKFIFSLFNLLMFGKKQAKVRRCIISTFFIFCHEMKNPTEKKLLDVISSKTQMHSEKVIEKIHLHKMYSDLEWRLKRMLDGYKRATLLQKQVMDDVFRVVAKRMKNPPFILEDALKAVESGKSPKKPKMGASGSYLMYGMKRYVAGVFKPFDEEIGGPNNPFKRSYRGEIASRIAGYKTMVGRGVFREVAAYIVSHCLGLNIVPMTCFAEFSHEFFYNTNEGFFLQKVKTKRGSFQEYKAGFKHVYELSKKALEEIPLDQFHRIFILDVIIGNMDRNLANLLTNGSVVVAIDHALSFGAEHGKLTITQFKEIPQFNIPLRESLQEKVLNFSVEALAGKLKKECLIDEASLRRMKERATLLKEFVERKQTVLNIIDLLTIDNLNKLRKSSSHAKVL